VDRLSRRIGAARAAVLSLRESLGLDVPEAVRRDCSILRFVLAFEATWKAARQVLLAEHGIDVASPKESVRASVRTGLIRPEDAEKAMKLASDRNLTMHVYDETLAASLAARLPEYQEILDRWSSALARSDDP